MFLVLQVGLDLRMHRLVSVLAAVLAAVPAAIVVGIQAVVDHRAEEDHLDSRLEELLHTLLGPDFARV
jgi:hypothetical protein